MRIAITRIEKRINATDCGILGNGVSVPRRECKGSRAPNAEYGKCDARNRLSSAFYLVKFRADWCGITVTDEYCAQGSLAELLYDDLSH